MTAVTYEQFKQMTPSVSKRRFFKKVCGDVLVLDLLFPVSMKLRWDGSIKIAGVMLDFLDGFPTGSFRDGYYHQCASKACGRMWSEVNALGQGYMVRPDEHNRYLLRLAAILREGFRRRGQEFNLKN